MSLHRRALIKSAAAIAMTQGSGCASLNLGGSGDATGNENSILIKGGFLYAADEANTVIPNSWVLVKGKRIGAVGSVADPMPAADKQIDARGKLVLPGFNNPHWHESFIQGPFKMKPDDSDLRRFAFAKGGDIERLSSYFGVIADIGEKVTYEEGLALARWSLWTQLRSGTTALGDIGSLNSTDAMAQAAIDLGMRLRVSRWGSDIMIPNGATEYKRVAPWQKQADDWAALMEKWDGHSSGLVGGMPSILACFGSSDEQLIALRDIAAKHNSPYACHLAPLRNEAAALKPIFGRTAIGRFDEFGMLTDRLLAVHTAYATEPEYQRLVETKVNINYSTANYALLGEHTVSETKMIGRLLADGVTVSCSTDGNDSYTGGIPEAMRATYLMVNESMNDNTACPPTLALAIGTRHGAIALGWGDRTGSIEPGKEADIVLANIDDWRFRLISHPFSVFLITGGSNDVDTVMVAGKVVVENGRSKTINEREMFEDYKKAVKVAYARITG